MKTIVEILKLSTEYLAKRQIVNPRRQAEEVVGDALHCARLDLYLEFDRPLNDKEIDCCRQAVLRRGKREPPQYILGKVEFYNCELKVTPAVLIPRPETEILVDKISKQLAELDLHNKQLWDIACGSGCIGIALKKRFPELKVVLSDLSSEALKVAAENANSNQVEVETRLGDLFTPFSGEQTNFLVTNPPYISSSEFTTLDPEVKDYEPQMALVAGETGLEFYKRFSEELGSYLGSGSKVWMEIGASQGEEILRLFDKPKFTKQRVEKDWAGHDRFFSLEIE